MMYNSMHLHIKLNGYKMFDLRDQNQANSNLFICGIKWSEKKTNSNHKICIIQESEKH